MPQLSSSKSYDMPGKSLLAIEDGRIFCRRAGDGDGAGYLGIVAVPRSILGETLHACRLNSGLWMNEDHSSDAIKRMDSPHITAKTFGELDANNLFNSMKFSQGLMPDAIELFVRRTFIEHEDPSMSWSLIIGASAKRLPALEKDGLYEIKSGAISHIDANIYVGFNLGQVFREPVWGPRGKYGIGTTMEPGFFHSWAEEDRAQNAKRDPCFAAYLAAMKDHPIPLVYTENDLVERKELAGQVMMDLLNNKKNGPKAAAIRPLF